MASALSTDVIVESADESEDERSNITTASKDEEEEEQPFSEILNTIQIEKDDMIITRRKSSKGFDTTEVANSAAASSEIKPIEQKISGLLPPTNGVAVDETTAPGEATEGTGEDGEGEEKEEITLNITSPYHFEPEPKPVTSDDEYDTDMEVEEPHIKYGAFGTHSYLEKCKSLHIVPVSYVLRNLQYEVLNIAHHGLGPLGTKALSVALVHNSTVTSLNIEDNGIGALGGGYIGEMLTENSFITEINMSNNQIGSEKLQLLVSAMPTNSSLNKVNLSNNGFKDRDAVHLAKIFTSNYIRELNLSHNELGDRAGILFGKAIIESYGIINIDLSWNTFRGRPAVKLIDGIKANNFHLKEVNISWNGITDTGAMALVRCIKNNPRITHIDASSNRITDAPVKALCRVISNSQTLVELRLASNQFKPPSAVTFLKALQKETCAVRLLDLSGTWVYKDFEQAYLDLLRQKPVTILFSGVLEKTERKGRILTGPLVASSLISLMDKYATCLVKDMSTKAGEESSDLMTHEDFRKCIKEANIGLTEDQINRLVKKYDSGNADGTVNYRKMIANEEEEL